MTASLEPSQEREVRGIPDRIADGIELEGRLEAENGADPGDDRIETWGDRPRSIRPY